MKLLHPTTIDLDLEPVDGVELVAYDPRQEVPPEHRDAEALIAWGNPRDRLRHAASVMKRLEWVQTLAAGPDSVLGAGFAPEVVITSGRGLQNLPVAEHALALLLAAARRVHEMRDAQREARWPGHLGGIQRHPDPAAFRSLIGAHVLVWGFGGIGGQLARYLTMMQARVTGVASTSGERAGSRVVTAADVDAILPEVDAVIMILPADASTKHALSRDRLRLLRPHAWVVNVGRGSTIDEAALAEALAQGHLGGAALDVFEEEPLPASSPLWALSNVIVSPHAAGGRPMGAEALVMRNLRALISGGELENVVQRAP
jgi:phosphoglycerate dehydrogenase-like enzyme